MKQTLTFLLLLAALLVPGNASAQTHSVVSEGLTLLFTVSGNEATITGTPNKINNPRQPLGSGGYDLTNGGIVNIPAIVSVGINNYTVTTIGSQAFMDCNITSLTLPSTLKEIKMRAFASSRGGCDLAFDDLVIPASVQRLENDCFFNQRIKHLSFETGSQLSYIARKAFGTYRPASSMWDNTFTQSAEYNIEYYDFSNTQLTKATFGGPSQNQQFFMFLQLQGKILMYLPATFDVYPCGNLNNRMSGGDIDQTADETNIVRANGYCDNLLISDDMSFRAPHAFIAKKATYNRTFSNVAGKAVSTLYLPYPTDLPTGMQAYELTHRGVDAGGDKAFCFSPVPLGTRLAANKPYLVRITDGQNHTLPEMQNVQVPVTPDIETSALVASSDSDWKFYGTTEFMGNTAAYAKKAYYLNGNKWWVVQSGVTNDYIAPFRCFISSPTNATPAKSFLMVLDDDHTTTDIHQLENETEQDVKSGRHTFYSIDGKRMGTNYDTLERGQMYVVNGKKFYKF